MSSIGINATTAKKYLVEARKAREQGGPCAERNVAFNLTHARKYILRVPHPATRQLLARIYRQLSLPSTPPIGEPKPTLAELNAQKWADLQAAMPGITPVDPSEADDLITRRNVQ